MHHKSGSALSKVSFVLVLFIAAAAGYLVVRERLRARNEQEAMAAAEAAATKEAEIFKAVAKFNSNTAAAHPEFAPLRDRVVTNTVRVPSNRFIAVSQATGGPPVVLVGETKPYPRNEAQPVLANVSPMIVGAGGGRGGGASVTGRVFLRGTPPPEKVIALDAACAALQPAPITTRHYLVSGEGGLADVFVYVKTGAPSVAAPTGGVAPLLDQVNCEYQPYIIGVQAGQALNVRNSDALLHNVHVLAKAPGNRERNIGQPVKGMTTRLVFDKPEVFVQFKCDVHPWMFAYVGVVEHPWFAVTDRQGNFTLPAGLPPGQYTLAAVHRKAGEQTLPLLVNADGVEPVTLTFEVPPQ